MGYCTSPSDVQPLQANQASTTIAAQGSNCVGHYLECTVMCEAHDERPWVEVVPQTGYGLSCDAVIAQPPGDCAAGDGGCGNADACSLTGVMVDTVAGAGTIEFTYDQPQQCTNQRGWSAQPNVWTLLECADFEANPSRCTSSAGLVDFGNGPATEACCVCGGQAQHPCTWYITCLGLQSPSLTFRPPPPPVGQESGYLPPGHTVTVSDGLQIGARTAPLLESLSGNVGQRELQATGRSITVTFIRQGDAQPGDGFSASWLCH